MRPSCRYGELESRWVALDTWTFTLQFSGNESGMPDLLQKQQVLLQLGGIDTFGTVTLNGKVLLKPNNFHRCEQQLAAMTKVAHTKLCMLEAYVHLRTALWQVPGLP